MARRFISIWFRYLHTDWFALRQRYLHDVPFVLRTNVHGRMVITAANAIAQQKGVDSGMVLADARAAVPELEVMDDKPDLAGRLLTRLAEWCIRFTPLVSIDPPDGLLFDASGCSHLWGGDVPYLEDIMKRLRARGYHVRAAMADTAGAAWAVARYGEGPFVTGGSEQLDALMLLPPEALRLEEDAIARLHKLGLTRIRQFIQMPRTSLRRRFGPQFLLRLYQALGQEEEAFTPVFPIESYQERLPCLEPIVTATGIAIALEQLLESLCGRLRREQKGLRSANFKGYRVDGKVIMVSVSTGRPSHHVKHLFKLFDIRLPTLEPGEGIELFVLEAPKVEDHVAGQEKLWEEAGGLDDMRLSELLDRLANRVGPEAIKRYLPDEHYWPERSYKLSLSLQEKTSSIWRTDKLRPLQLLAVPEPIEAVSPQPDYPPMLFRYKGKVHNIVRANGPERIEQEWWLQQGQHRDYYGVEDEDGGRYWLFRLGHYQEKVYQWFLHGFFS